MGTPPRTSCLIIAALLVLGHPVRGNGMTDTKAAGNVNNAMERDHLAKHKADIEKAPPGSVITTITKKKGSDQYKTVWFKETHVKHVPVVQHMPVYTHVIRGVPVPIAAPPPPPVPPPPPPVDMQIDLPPMPLPPARPMIKAVPVIKTIQVKTYKTVLTDENDSEARLYGKYLDDGSMSSSDILARQRASGPQHLTLDWGGDVGMHQATGPEGDDKSRDPTHIFDGRDLGYVQRVDERGSGVRRIGRRRSRVYRALGSGCGSAC